MPDIKFTTVAVCGQSFDVFLTPNALFRTEVEQRTLAEPTFRWLIERLTDCLRERKVQVAISFVQARTGRRGTCTGIHASTGKFLVRWQDDSRKVVQEDLRGLSVLHNLSDLALAEYLTLVEARKQSEARVEAFEKAQRLSLTEAVHAAVAAEKARLQELEDKQ